MWGGGCLSSSTLALIIVIIIFITNHVITHPLQLHFRISPPPCCCCCCIQYPVAQFSFKPLAWRWASTASITTLRVSPNLLWASRSAGAGVPEKHLQWQRCQFRACCTWWTCRSTWTLDTFQCSSKVSNAVSFRQS